ncbi:unnamed protein product [Sphacelaria rigidula]
MVFGDKKGNAKLRHDKIRHEEQKAKQDGQAYVLDAENLKAGGPGREPPSNSSLNALWEIVEMDCRAARFSDTLCDELEEEHLLGKVKTMGNTIHKRFKELAEEGDLCVERLRSIDKCVGEAYNKLKENLGSQIGGKDSHEDVWILDCSYRTAVVHQKEAWEAVTAKLREIFSKIKALEVERRESLRDFLVGANAAVAATWLKFPTITGAAIQTAGELDASQRVVEHDVTTKAAAGVAEKRESSAQSHQLAPTTGVICLGPPPADTSFIDSLTASLESPLVRTMMMMERRESKAIGSKYHAGLLILTWDGFIHFFDMPESSSMKTDVSPAAAFQEISPSITLDELVQRKSVEDALLIKANYTLALDEESIVEIIKSSKSHKFEVKGTKQGKTILSNKKHITFRTNTEAQMVHAVANITECIQSRGGMNKSETGYPVQFDPTKPLGSRVSMDSDTSSHDGVKDPSGYTKQAYTRVDSDTVAAPQPAPAPGQAPLIMPLAGNASMPESVVYGSNPGSVASFASTSQGAAGASDGGGGGTSSSSDLSSAVAAANAATAASASAASGEQPPEAAPGKE